MPAQRRAESPQPCVAPATCSNFAALRIASNHTNKSGFLPVSAAGAFLAEHGIVSLLLHSQENTWGHGSAESFLLGSTQDVPPTPGEAAPKHSCPLEVLDIQVPLQPQEQLLPEKSPQRKGVHEDTATLLFTAQTQHRSASSHALSSVCCDPRGLCQCSICRN